MTFKRLCQIMNNMLLLGRPQPEENIITITTNTDFQHTAAIIRYVETPVEECSPGFDPIRKIDKSKFTPKQLKALKEFVKTPLNARHYGGVCRLSHNFAEDATIEPTVNNFMAVGYWDSPLRDNCNDPVYHSSNSADGV